jgi:hypothetical protein
MKSLFKNLFAHLGTVASITGLIFSLKNPDKQLNGWHWTLIIISIILFVLTIFFLTQDYLKNKPKLCKNKKEIRDYMYKWISNGGRVVIFTRDMSWVSDREMIDMLNNKARGNELTLCLPNRFPLVNELERAGASIIEYSNLNYTPRSRFTIINYGRDDAKVAVGKRLTINKHLIEEYSIGEHPYFNVANDLINILERNRI